VRKSEFNWEMVLRAKIDMSSPNINMRDPIIYRIAHGTHHNTGDKWCIYPMYDFAHPIEDAIEGITHSICTLEFADHRPLYDWIIQECETENVPKQYEFARLNITNTVMSKELKQLVDEALWMLGMHYASYRRLDVRLHCRSLRLEKLELQKLTVQ
jgi:glutaminyl-tRNA synthetase